MTAEFEKILEFEIPNSANGQRLDRWVSENNTDLSRAKIQKLIKRGRVLVNGKRPKSSFILKTGQHLRIEVEAERPSARLIPQAMTLDVLYEDDQVLVLNKPAGISVHPGAGTSVATLIEGVMHRLGRKETQAGDNIRPGIVHRLDKDTTGVMVYAKDEVTQAHLSKQFASKLIPREYIALLDGQLKQESIEYETYLYRDPQHRKRFASISEKDYIKKFGQPVKAGSGYRIAKTKFIKNRSYQSRLTLASIFLRTGRTHQIRVHSKDLQCPVLGDPIYNSPHEYPKVFPLELRKKISELKRQMLHARTLGFIHPKTGIEMNFEAPLPEDFQELLNALKPFQDTKESEVF